METERLLIDPIRETDKADYFRSISHDKTVLETFICRYAESMEAFDFSSCPGRRDLFAIRLKETWRMRAGFWKTFKKKSIPQQYGRGWRPRQPVQNLLIPSPILGEIA